MTHICHAKGCTVAVPPKLLMCRRHWYMVPKPLRDAVWTYYRPGQETSKFSPSPPYLQAARAAIEAVEKAEARS